MRIALLADLHARGKDLAEFRAQWTAALDACHVRGVRDIAIAGDIFDSSNICSRGVSTGAVVRAVAEPLAAFMKTPGAFCLMIPGNHDKAGAGAEDALATLEQIPGVAVQRTPAVIDLATPFADGTQIACLPWLYDGPTAEEVLADLVAQNCILLAHLQVRGAILSGKRTHDGEGRMTVSRTLLEKLPFVRYALGDFHARQELVVGRGGYIGALRQLNFGEEGNPTGFEVFDTDTREVEWVPLLNYAPRHKTTVIDNPTDIAWLAREFTRKRKYSINSAFSGIREWELADNQRFICRGWEPSKAEVRVAEEAGVQVVVERDYEERVARVSDIPPAEALTIPAVLDLWIAAQEPAIDPERADELRAELHGLIADETPAVVPQEAEAVSA